VSLPGVRIEAAVDEGTMREICPAENMSADEFLDLASEEAKTVVSEIRRQKQNGTRPRPSTKLIDRSLLLAKPQRERLLDAVAELVDENLFGRSEMCLQFADLLQRALAHLGLSSRSVVGWAIYYSKEGKEVFRWKHAWVRIGKEVIDGNVDSLPENLLVPKIVDVEPYWGPIGDIPGRRLREDQEDGIPPDSDVSETWWPELQGWLSQEFQNRA